MQANSPADCMSAVVSAVDEVEGRQEMCRSFRYNSQANERGKICRLVKQSDRFLHSSPISTGGQDGVNSGGTICLNA